MRGEYKAFLQRDMAASPFGGTVRLYVWSQSAYGREFDCLMSDGTWKTIDEGELAGDDAGLTLPIQSIDVLHEAIKQYRGDALDSTTETKVLREWLISERGRVDKLIEQ